MWRAMPLLKMNARMLLVGVALAAAYWLAAQLMLEYRGNRFLQYFMRDVVAVGTCAGLMLSIPMTLATLVFFREIQRPLFYRFAMVSVSLLAALSIWGPRADLREVILSPGRDNRWLIVYALSSLFFVLLVFCSGLAARAYSREFHRRKLARQKAKANVDHRKQ